MHKSKKSVKRTWSAWGDWIWSSSQGRYYRQRQDLHGNRETQWGPEYPADDEDDDNVPRGIPRRKPEEDDDLANRLRGVHIEDSAGSEEDIEPPDYSHKKSSSAVYSPDPAAGSSQKDKKRKDKKERGKGKEKAYVDSEGDDEDDYGRMGDDEHGYGHRRGYDDARKYREQEEGDPEEEEPVYTPYGHSTQHPSSRKTSRRAGGSGGYSPVDDDADEDYHRAANESRRPYRQGGSSTNPRGGPNDFDDPDAQSDSAQTARTLDHISGNHPNDPDPSLLDPRYRIEPSYKFQPGEVFKALWPEPAGHTSTKLPSVSDRRELPDGYGGRVFVGFRRFIVVANDAGHCTCVPISTYGGKACKKKGIKADKHGIIAEKGVKVRALEGEPKLGFPLVRMKVDVDGERLSPQSRVNYSKIVTVEHNVKVFLIGSITAHDYEIVHDAVNACWEKKNFHQRRR